jgi:hypothetical protein
MIEQNPEFRRVTSSWHRGFNAIYHKELAVWFGTHKWINQVIICIGTNHFIRRYF